MLEACFSAAHATSSSALAVRGQGSEPRREASTTSWCTSVNKILGKPLEPKTSPNPPEPRDMSPVTRSKEITGSTQTRSRRSSRPAVGVAVGYCCRIAAPPRQRRRRGHWSRVRACVCRQVHIHDYENWQWQPARLEPLHRESTRVKRGIIARLFKPHIHIDSPPGPFAGIRREFVSWFLLIKNTVRIGIISLLREKKLVQFRTDCVRREKNRPSSE